MDKMPQIIEQYNIHLGIIAVPPQYGQEAAEMLVSSGIEGILNFAPTSLKIPNHIKVQNVDLSASLESITYSITREKVMPLYYL